MTPDQLKAVYPEGKMPQLQAQQYLISPDKTYLVISTYLNQELFPSLSSLNAYVVRSGTGKLLGSTIFTVDSIISPLGEETENLEEIDDSTSELRKLE